MTQIPAEAMTLVSAAIDATPIFVDVTTSHVEFLDWAQANGMDPKIHAFLAQRDDGAGASPRQWMQLSEVGTSPWHPGLPEDVRRAITRSIIGEDAFRAYVTWVVEEATGEKEPKIGF